jgi:hypothetical protein
MTGSLLAEDLICSDCLGLKSVEEQDSNHVSHVSDSKLKAQYRNVRQLKLGTNIIQTVHSPLIVLNRLTAH